MSRGIPLEIVVEEKDELQLAPAVRDLFKEVYRLSTHFPDCVYGLRIAPFKNIQLPLGVNAYNLSWMNDPEHLSSQHYPIACSQQQGSGEKGPQRAFLSLLTFHGLENEPLLSAREVLHRIKMDFLGTRERKERYQK